MIWSLEITGTEARGHLERRFATLISLVPCNTLCNALELVVVVNSFDYRTQPLAKTDAPVVA